MTRHDNPLADPLDQLAAYAPTADAPPTMLLVKERILAHDRGADDGARQIAATPGLVWWRRPRTLVAATGVAALAVAGAVVVPGLTGGSAYASWTASPDPLVGADLAQADRLCGESAGGDTLVAERRGVFRFLVSSDGVEVSDCLVDGDGTGGGSTTRLADLDAPTAREALVGGYMTTWGPRNGDVTAIHGPTGDDVNGVTVVRSNGYRVEATVESGWWAAWWPGRADEDATIVVHRTDGTSSAPIRVDDPAANAGF